MLEHELIERCRQGDRSAQHEVYSRTAERIYWLLLRITGNRDDASDLAQDTYVRAFTRARQFDGRSSFETWLCRIAINQALQERRRVTLAQRTLATSNGRDVQPATCPAQDQRIDVEDALAQLSTADRTIVVLRYQEGLDYAAIADLVGCPPGTVASRLNRARLRVRELLKKSYAEQEEIHCPVHPIDRNEGERRSRHPICFHRGSGEGAES